MALPVTCFLIDDDEDDQEIFALALEKVDPILTCVTADDGVEALEKLQDDHIFIPNFIFLDLNMPRMNGKQCLVELKKIDRLQQTPIIIFSTSAEPGDIRETKRLGADYFLTKTPLIEDLKASLTKIFGSHPRP